jgi:excinuclease UvrABC nuclease subunit
MAQGKGRVALYRHFDEDDVLLYIGVADNLALRLSTHERESLWRMFAVRAEVEWLPDRTTALKAEQALIKELQPIFNTVHADKGRPERVRDYLVKQRAWQYLQATI